MTRKLAFAIAVALQFLLLGWMVGSSERTLARGVRVVLKVHPVDPVDFLTGRYVSAPPEVNVLDPQTVELLGFPTADEVAGQADAAEGDPRFRALSGQTVFVELAPVGDFWSATRVLTERAGEAPRAPFLRGRVEWSNGPLLHVDYGLDRFNMPYDAEDPSFLMRKEGHSVALAVKVDGFGHGVTEDLLVDLRPFAEWNRAEKAKAK